MSVVNSIADVLGVNAISSMKLSHVENTHLVEQQKKIEAFQKQPRRKLMIGTFKTGNSSPVHSRIRNPKQQQIQFTSK